MTRKATREAILPDTDNPSQESQTANAIRNQSSVKPEDFPEHKRNAAKEQKSTRETP